MRPRAGENDAQARSYRWRSSLVLAMVLLGAVGLVARAVELAAQVAEVPGPTMLGLKEIYDVGAAAVIGPALAAEDAIAGAQEHDLAGLGEQFRSVSERNKSQLGR